jgi:uncharacterized FlaG/YvyC family protein
METSAVSRASQPLEVGAPAASPEHAVPTRDVVQAVKALNATEMLGEENEAVYQVDRQTHRIVIQIVNKKTKEVQAQIPPEYVLRLGQDLNQSEK